MSIVVPTDTDFILGYDFSNLASYILFIPSPHTHANFVCELHISTPGRNDSNPHRNQCHHQKNSRYYSKRDFRAYVQTRGPQDRQPLRETARLSSSFQQWT